MKYTVVVVVRPVFLCISRDFKIFKSLSFNYNERSHVNLVHKQNYCKPKVKVTNRIFM